MDIVHLAGAASALLPATLMLLAALLPRFKHVSTTSLWRAFSVISTMAVITTLSAIYWSASAQDNRFFGLLLASPIGLGMALLVQLLGTVIGAFSSRYLQGEAGQRRYVAALASVLAAVHVLLLADHWVVFIAAWAVVGVALQHLLCFYADRPFALLATHKKRLADRAADGLLIAAAGLAWWTVGSGSMTDLTTHLEQQGTSAALQVSAVLLVLAVILRTALMPVHGWLIQVMEAPTPVSALLHAGVVNLGGFVLIRFAPLLEHAMPARSLLVAFGLLTAVLAGLVMLTRISIKVRLAWSTTAQMGFMLLECGLGLYTLAALHLFGHSLYKAHAFLSASTIVQQTRLKTMRGAVAHTPISLFLAPIVAIASVLLLQGAVALAAWPWWWSAVLGLAWAPLLWLPAHRADWLRTLCLQSFSGLLMVAGLTGAALLAHALPLDIHDAPNNPLGVIALLGMTMLYLCLVTLQLRPQALGAWQRWSYAGFYVDEIYTRIALRLWPTRWTRESSTAGPSLMAPRVAADTAQ